MSSFLYVISNGEAFKVGFSKDPKRRVRQLQTGNPKRLVLVYTKEIEVAPIRLIEDIVHRSLKFTKVQGEWFKADLEKIKLELDFVKIRYDNEDTVHEYSLGILDYNK